MKYSCHTINTKPHEGNDLAELISAALCDLMGREWRPLLGGQLKVKTLNFDIHKNYELSYRIGSRGLECRGRASLPGRYDPYHPPDHKAWLYGFNLAPFTELAQRIAQDFFVHITCQRLLLRR